MTTTAAHHRARAIQALTNAIELAVMPHNMYEHEDRARYIAEAVEELELAVRLAIEESRGVK
jgi:hypothetical protein